MQAYYHCFQILVIKWHSFIFFFFIKTWLNRYGHNYVRNILDLQKINLIHKKIYVHKSLSRIIKIYTFKFFFLQFLFILIFNYYRNNINRNFTHINLYITVHNSPTMVSTYIEKYSNFLQWIIFITIIIIL